MNERTIFSTRVLVRGDQSGGAVSVVENIVPAGWAGPPLHRHGFDEAFYVLDGELTFQVGERLVRAGPGGLAFAPGGTEHTFANLGTREARYLIVFTPAGFERFFDRLAAKAAGVEPPASAREPLPDVTVVGGHVDDRVGLGDATMLTSREGRVRVLVRGEDSRGRLALMDNGSSASGGGPPLHHHAFDETFYVVDGELTFQLGEEIVTRRSGELVFAARGAHHTFANQSGAEARVLILCTPAGFERYFDWMAARDAGDEAAEQLANTWPEVTKVGPPLASRAAEAR